MTAKTLEDLFLLGNTRLAAKDYAGAEQSYLQALALHPECGELLANLAFVKEQQNSLTEARAYYSQAQQQLPGNLQICLNFGALLTRLKAFDEAEILYRHLLSFAPDSAAAWSNFGVMLACALREDEAELAYRTSLHLQPDYPKAKFNLSYLLLRQGRFDEGWQQLEARPWQTAFDHLFTFPRWREGGIANRKILIVFEGGFGDMLQFCRYAQTLKEMGASRIGLLCHPPLKRLLKSLSGIDFLIGYDEDLTDFNWDCWIPILSLPHLCTTTLATIPAVIPYLSADADLRQDWQQRLGARRLRIGLVWQGNPLFENDADRSLPGLPVLLPLLNQNDVQWISLQKGAGAKQAQAWRATPLVCADKELHDFADTAALLAELDLLISIDSAVAHLAGALGKPCYLLLPYYRQDWRWLKQRDDTPWYPQMRLFRQSSDGDWDSVVAAVVRELAEFKVVYARKNTGS